jgi:outer membrane protein assembly factor BamB
VADMIRFHNMKKIKQISILIAILAATMLLSACVGGGAATATSWAGFKTDAENQVVYLAHGAYIYAVDIANPIASGDPKDPTPKYQQKWRFGVSKATFYATPVLTDDGQLLAASYDHSLYSLNPQTGLQNWAFTGSGSKLVTNPLVSDGIIYQPSSDYNLYALDLKGNLLWQYETGNALWATPVTDGKVIYQPSMDHHVYALDAKTGKLIWKSEDLAGPIAGQPTLSPEGILYVGTFNKQLLAIDSKTGKQIWAQTIEGWGWSGPLLQDGSLYFGDLKGYIYGKSASDGSDLWQPNLPPAQEGQKANLRAIPEPPLLLDGKLYFASEVGSIYTTDPQAGNPIPFFTLSGSRLYTPPQPAGELLLVAPFGARQLLVGLNSNGQIIADFVQPSAKSTSQP